MDSKERAKFDATLAAPVGGAGRGASTLQQASGAGRDASEMLMGLLQMPGAGG